MTTARAADGAPLREKLTLVLTEISQLKMDTWAADEWQWIREMMSGSGVIDDYRDLFTAHGLKKPFFLSETIKKM